MKKSVITLLFSIIFSTVLQAQWTIDVMMNTEVHDNIGTEQVTPLVARGLQGQTFISWFDSENGNYQLKMQLLDSNGVAQWSPQGIVISNYPQNSALYVYDLASDKEGNAVVAFQDERTGDMQVVAYKIGQSGNFLWGPDGIVLTDSLAISGLAPAIGITNSNDVVIAWNAQGSSSKWVSFRRLSGNGTSMWPALHRITSTTKKYSRPSMVASGEADIILQYIEESGNFPAATSTQYAQRYDAQGNTVWAAAVPVSSKTIAYFYYPRIQSDQNDGFYLPFTTSNPLSIMMNDMYVQHMDANGNLWSPTGTEAADSMTHKTSAGGVFYNDNFYALLQVLDGNQSQSGIYIQKFDASGNVLFGNNGKIVLPVSSDYYLPYSINAVMDGLIIVYKQGGFANETLFAVKTDFNGNLSWTAPVMICGNTANKDDLSTVNINSFMVASVWMDERIDRGIYAQNISSAGYPGLPTSIVENNNTMGFTVYPNPGSCNMIQADLSVAGTAKLTLHDALGNQVKTSTVLTQKGTNTIHFDTENLPAGVYFLQLTNNNDHVVSKLIIQ